MLRTFYRLAVVAVLVSACTDDREAPGQSTTAATRACEPLALGLRIAYAARAADGRVLYVFEDPVTFRYRPFLGMPERVLERTVVDDNRDSSVHLTIDVDGAAILAQLQFRISFVGWGRPRLQPATGNFAEGPGAVLLDPLPGSPGADWDADRLQLASGSDAGVDAGASSPRAADRDLVSGASFLCF